jgi:hypothetical protein
MFYTFTYIFYMTLNFIYIVLHLHLCVTSYTLRLALTLLKWSLYTYTLERVKNIAKLLYVYTHCRCKSIYTHNTGIFLEHHFKTEKKSIKDSPCFLAPHAPSLNHYTNTHTSEKLWFLFKTMDTHKVHN